MKANEVFKHITDKELIIYDILDSLDNDKDFAELTKLIPEATLKLIKICLQKIMFQIDTWHNKDDEESHIDLRNKIEDLQAQINNHRHDFSKRYSGKAET